MAEVFCPWSSVLMESYPFYSQLKTAPTNHEAVLGVLLDALGGFDVLTNFDQRFIKSYAPQIGKWFGDVMNRLIIPDFGLISICDLDGMGRNYALDRSHTH